VQEKACQIQPQIVSGKAKKKHKEIGFEREKLLTL